MENRTQSILERYGKKVEIDLSYFIGNGFWVFLRQLLAAFGSVILYAVFVRYAEQEFFGSYQFVLTIVAIIGITALPGMGAALVQASVRKYDGTYRRMFSLIIRGSFVGSVILVFLATYFFRGSSEFGFSLLLVAALFPLFSAFSLWDSFLQGKERFDVIAKYSVVLILAQTVSVCLAVILFRENLIAAIAMYFLVTILTSGVLYLKSLRFIQNEVVDDESIKFGFFMTKVSVLGIIAEQIDKVLVGLLLGPANLAVYTVISFFGVKIKDAIRSFASMLVPKLTLEEMNFLQLMHRHKKVILIIAISASIISVVFFLFVDTVNSLIFTDKYSMYSALSRAYAITLLLSIPLTVAGYYVYAKRNAYALMLSSTVFYALRIAMNIIGIYFYGLIGAVVAYNLSMIVLLFIYWWGIYHEEHLISLQR